MAITITGFKLQTNNKLSAFARSKTKQALKKFEGQAATMTVLQCVTDTTVEVLNAFLVEKTTVYSSFQENTGIVVVDISPVDAAVTEAMKSWTWAIAIALSRMKAKSN